MLNAKLLPWLENALASMNNGIRRLDQELLVAFCNLPAAGVVSAYKQHFLLTQLTSLAHSFPRAFVAVLVMPNRAADLRSAKPLVSRLSTRNPSKSPALLPRTEVKDEGDVKTDPEADEAGLPMVWSKTSMYSKTV